jgi:hypothetical protein
MSEEKNPILRLARKVHYKVISKPSGRDVLHACMKLRKFLADKPPEFID